MPVAGNYDRRRSKKDRRLFLEVRGVDIWYNFGYTHNYENSDIVTRSHF